VVGWWFSPVSSTNKTDRHDLTEILLKVALNTIKPREKMTKQNKYHGKTIEIGSLIRTINLLQYQNHSEKCFFNQLSS
jgi:hypothetical protein